MKRMDRILVVFAAVALGAVAQNEDADARAEAATKRPIRIELQPRVKLYGVDGAVMGPAVKNAPYSAVEITETNQTLGDGTLIHQENQTSVYRDSEGRVRRETPVQATIWDPVAKTGYSLNLKTQTARKLPLGSAFLFNGSGYELVLRANEAAAALDALKANVQQSVKEEIRVQTGGRGAIGLAKGVHEAKTESLGKQTIEGVVSEGTRVTSTIETGAIGNDRPILITSESWYSPELQTLIKSVHTDPRTGEEIFRLTNVSRAEPPSTLFQVPAEYQVMGAK